MMKPSLTLTILSNGYGEDSIGAKLAAEMLRQRPDWQVQAYPTVDAGNAYAGLGIPILGQRKIMPSGGLMVHHPQLFMQDIAAGFLSMLVRQLADLARLQTDALILVGDVYTLLLSQLINTKQRFYVQSLVSAYHRNENAAWHRQTMENFTLLERSLIRARKQREVQRIYVRDAKTAAYLQAHGFGQARFLGNPMMDGLAEDRLEPSLYDASATSFSDAFSAGDNVDDGSPEATRLALLAGSRDYAPTSLALMLSALAAWGAHEKVNAFLAWSRPVAEVAPLLAGWRKLAGGKARGHLASYQQGRARVHLLQGRFGAVLHAADVVWGTAGTANEQAAGLGKPVLSFVVAPFYSHKFLANQKRLLAEALTISRPERLWQDTRALLDNPPAYHHACQVGQARMGQAGGTARIVADVIHKLEQV